MHSKFLGTLLIFALGHTNAVQNHTVTDSMRNLHPIVKFENLTQEKIDHFFNETEHFIIDCPAGTKLPVSLSVAGDLLALEPETLESTITFLKHCYITYRNNEFLVSVDLGQWKSLQEFTTGSISTLLNAHHGRLQASVLCEINEKK